jgi:hypothetical protein
MFGDTKTFVFKEHVEIQQYWHFTYIGRYKNTVVPPYPLIQYLQFQLSAVCHSLKNNLKIEEINSS